MEPCNSRNHGTVGLGTTIVIIIIVVFVHLQQYKLTNNRLDDGGGGGAISVDSGSVSISNSELTHNRANYNGGAIWQCVHLQQWANKQQCWLWWSDWCLPIFHLDHQQHCMIIITNNIGSLNISQSTVTFTGMNIVSNNGPINFTLSTVESSL